MPSPIISPNPATINQTTWRVFLADQGCRWSAPSGTFRPEGSQEAWDPLKYYASVRYLPAAAGVVNITTTNLVAQTTIVPVTVTNVWPNLHGWSRPVKFDRNVEMFIPEDGPRQTNSTGGFQQGWEMGASLTPHEDFLLFLAWYKANFPQGRFLFDDVILGQLTMYEFDSILDAKPNDVGSWEWSIIIKQAWPYGSSS
jgi:hypothetical protein